MTCQCLLALIQFHIKDLWRLDLPFMKLFTSILALHLLFYLIWHLYIFVLSFNLTAMTCLCCSIFTIHKISLETLIHFRWYFKFVILVIVVKTNHIGNHVAGGCRVNGPLLNTLFRRHWKELWLRWLASILLDSLPVSEYFICLLSCFLFTSLSLSISRKHKAICFLLIRVAHCGLSVSKAVLLESLVKFIQVIFFVSIFVLWLNNCYLHYHTWARGMPLCSLLRSICILLLFSSLMYLLWIRVEV